MKVLECMTLVLRSLAKEKKPYNFLVNYSGNHRKDAKTAMNLLGNFPSRAEEVARRMALKKPHIYRALGESVYEKSVMKVLEQEGAVPKTVDLLYSGDPSQNVAGICCAFMATFAVLEEAKKRGANLVITHEPTFYSGNDQTDWLKDDPVYQKKERWLKENGMAVWRLHDMLHLFQPDMIVQGTLAKLGWTENADFQTADNVIVSFADGVYTKKSLAADLRNKLNCGAVRTAGNMSGNVRKIGLSVGASGGRPQIALAGAYDLDALVCGEINEWETAAYVKDAFTAGKNIALYVIGHQESETAGMEYFADWLKEKCVGLDIPVSYIDSGALLAAEK